jgi:hypothetical protein
VLAGAAGVHQDESTAPIRHKRQRHWARGGARGSGGGPVVGFECTRVIRPWFLVLTSSCAPSSVMPMWADELRKNGGRGGPESQRAHRPWDRREPATVAAGAADRPVPAGVQDINQPVVDRDAGRELPAQRDDLP